MKNLKRFTVVLLLAAMSGISSCNDVGFCIEGEGSAETRVLEVDDFTGVRTEGNTKVYVRQGAKQLVEVRGQANILDELETEVKGDVWQIAFDRCIRRHEIVEVYITVPELSYAEVNGSGLLEVQSIFKATDFHAQVSGSGDVVARVEAQHVQARISGSGTIVLSGKAGSQNIAVSGSGKVKNFNLLTEKGKIEISGSGNSEVNVSDELEVTISGSGKVFYKKNPAINSTISGSGKIINS